MAYKSPNLWIICEKLWITAVFFVYIEDISTQFHVSCCGIVCGTF